MSTHLKDAGGYSNFVNALSADEAPGIGFSGN
jgi:hypothetical protein